MPKYIYEMKKCPYCDEERKSNGLHMHIKTHGLKLWQEYLDNKDKQKAREVEGGFKCIDCDYYSKNKKSVSSHWWRNHTEEGKKHNPLRLAPRLNSTNSGYTRSGYTRDYEITPIWNKGLTKETDERVAKAGKTYSDRVKNGIIIPFMLGKKFSEERCQQISKQMSLNNKGGRCKWYDVGGQSVQGTWERSVAEKLSEYEIKWIKLKINHDTLKYIMNEKIRNYTPDFYLPEYDIYLEIKGFWRGTDKEKMRLVKEQHPDVNIILIEKEEYEKILEL